MRTALGYDGVGMRRSFPAVAHTGAIWSLVQEHGFTQRVIARLQVELAFPELQQERKNTLIP